MIVSGLISRSWGEKKDNVEKPITEISIIPILKLIMPLKSEIKDKARQRKKENVNQAYNRTTSIIDEQKPTLCITKINQAYNRSPHYILQEYLNRPKAIYYSNKVQFNGFLNRPMSGG